MAKRFLVRLAGLVADNYVFEEIPEKVFECRQFAVNDTETGQRYVNDNFVVLNDGTIEELQLHNVRPSAMAIICRALSVKPFEGSVQNGFVREPSHVKFVNARKKKWLVETSTGLEYKLR